MGRGSQQRQSGSPMAGTLVSYAGLVCGCISPGNLILHPFTNKDF